MQQKAKRFFKEWVLPLGLEVLVLWVLLTYVFNITVVPTGSMVPTIAEESVLFCTRIYSPEKLERGDIVAFYSDELDLLLIKRLIGLPGDEVLVDADGHVHINGELSEEPYVKRPAARDDEQLFEVPEGHYLFFGDNRAGSNDARGWDNPYIPEDKIVCKAQFTLWPLQNFGGLE